MSERNSDGVGHAGAATSSKVTVKRIAEEMGVSMWHLNRVFKRITGRPPKAWAKEQVHLS